MIGLTVHKSATFGLLEGNFVAGLRGRNQAKRGLEVKRSEFHDLAVAAATLELASLFGPPQRPESKARRSQ